MQLKIFSYNIHGLPYLPDSWTAPLELWFKNTDYDFICLQEVFTVGRTELLSKRLHMEGYTVCKPNDFLERQNLLGSGLITAVKSNIWKVESEGFIQFKESIGAENLANKGIHWLLLEHKISEKPLLLINTHMQADHPFNYFAGCLDTRPTRRSQVVQLYEFIKSLSAIKHIIVGDLNSETEAHEELRYLTGSSNGINKHTFEPSGEDLDHIAIFSRFWAKLPVLKEISVLSNLWWSDHWPLHAIVEI
jgi:hypothetical protein